MADFTELKNAIREVIKENGNGEITGDILQNVLLAVLDAVNNKLISGDLDAEGHLFADADGMYSSLGGFKLLLPDVDNDRFFDDADGMLAEQGPILVVRKQMQSIDELITANPWLDAVSGHHDRDRAWNRLVYWATHNPRLDISDYTGEETIVALTNVIIKTAEERGDIEVFCDTRTGRNEPLQLYIDFDLQGQGQIDASYGTAGYVEKSQGIAIADGLGDTANNLLLPNRNYFLPNRKYFAEGAPILRVDVSMADMGDYALSELLPLNDWLPRENIIEVLLYWAKHNPTLEIIDAGTSYFYTFGFAEIWGTTIRLRSSVHDREGELINSCYAVFDADEGFTIQRTE